MCLFVNGRFAAGSSTEVLMLASWGGRGDGVCGQWRANIAQLEARSLAHPSANLAVAPKPFLRTC